jgi:hypothetical protein
MNDYASLLLVFTAAVGAALGITLVRWATRASAREIRHRLALLGLLALTVAGAGVAAPTPWTPDALEGAARIAARIALAGLLALLWTYWLRAERRSS